MLKHNLAKTYTLFTLNAFTRKVWRSTISKKSLGYLIVTGAFLLSK